MKKFIKKIIIGFTPPIITNLMRKTIDSNIHSDEYIDWICSILGGFLTRGNIRGFVYAIRHMPSGGAIVEIGSFLGLSTNIIAYLAIKYQRDNQFFTCDPWAFEGTDRPVGGYFHAESKVYRDYAKNVFIMNTALFSARKLPYTVEAYSYQFFKFWNTQFIVKDVFERSVTLGGPISFAYIDGAHDYDMVKKDFYDIDKHLLPHGFILFDDSAENGGFEGVTRVIDEVKNNPCYKIVFNNPNYLFEKIDST